MKNKITLLIICVFILNTTACEFSWNWSTNTTNDNTSNTNTINDKKISDNDPVIIKIKEFNECLKNDDVTPCKAMVAKDSGSISGTDAVRDVLIKFPPYMKALQEIEFIEKKETQADKGEKVYVVIGKAKFKNVDQILEMYARYNLADQNGELKIYGIQLDPSKLEAEF